MIVNALFVHMGEPTYDHEGYYNGWKILLLGDAQTGTIRVEIHIFKEDHMVLYVEMHRKRARAQWQFALHSHTGVAMPLRVGALNRGLWKALTEKNAMKRRKAEIRSDETVMTKKAEDTEARHVDHHSQESVHLFATMLTRMADMLRRGTHATFTHDGPDVPGGFFEDTVFVRLVKARAPDAAGSAEANTCEDNEDCHTGRTCPVTHGTLDDSNGVCVGGHCYDKDGITKWCLTPGWGLRRRRGRPSRCSSPISRKVFEFPPWMVGHDPLSRARFVRRHRAG